MAGHGDPIKMTARRGGALQGVAEVPGDKSISHRALILGALSVGQTEITGLLEGQDVTGLDSAARSHRGIGRSYQRTNIFPQFTVLENCRLAAQSRRPRPWRIFTDAMKTRDTVERARAAIVEAGLGGREQRKAGLLSHGEQRQLEIAMVLATDARVLLLDEPLAGMGSEESGQMVELLRKLKQNRAILLVEHDMDAVFAVADTITVMVEGSVLESGPPEQIRNSEEVQAAYLGEEEHG